MPATESAAAVTDIYRERLLAIRDTVTAAVAAQFDQTVVFDDLGNTLGEWAASAAALIRLGQTEAARLSVAYLPAFMSASGLEPQMQTADPEAYVGADWRGRHIDDAVESAAGVVPWRLGQSAGRAAAALSGVAAAVRVTRSSVQHTARRAVADAMQEDRRVVGWHRVVSVNPCGACLSLAGRRSTPSEPLRSHPSCRCTGEPVLDAVAERFVRPTGQQMYDRLTQEERVTLFASTGGADKVALVDQLGVQHLAATASKGDVLVETPLSKLAALSESG